jgi:beta-galactosidase GanA
MLLYRSIKKKIQKVNIISLTLSVMFVIISCKGIKPDSKDTDIPHLEKQGSSIQLVVNRKPLLMIAGELGNSSASSTEYMRQIWPKLADMNLNTVLAPVYWELIETEEESYDFTLVDSLIYNARSYNMRLILLWFASWKNSMSCYVPGWVKSDQERFPRAHDKDGNGMEMLTAFSDENRNADARAFSALMKHIRETDGVYNTVIMIQVENEIGMIPEARDKSIAANKAFSGRVPQELMDYLVNNKESLIPEFKKVWEKNGYKNAGTWEEVFGKGLGTEEIFTAWHFARYTNYIAKAGKDIYPLPMYVNAALIRPGYLPGQYPSGGPLPHLLDIWRAGAPDIDFLSPDIYFRNFKEWCNNYHRSGNPLFIPEARLNHGAAINVLYAIGQHDALGFSPFSIESASNAAIERITACYDVLSQLSPLILEKQGKGLMAGVLIDSIMQTQQISLGKYIFNVRHTYNWIWSDRGDESGPSPSVGGIIIQTGENEYVVAGSGIIITFNANSSEDVIAGISSIDEGKYIDGQWVPERRLNGDQSHQGRHMRLEIRDFSIQLIRLYTYN